MDILRKEGQVRTENLSAHPSSGLLGPVNNQGRAKGHEESSIMVCHSVQGDDVA